MKHAGNIPAGNDNVRYAKPRWVAFALALTAVLAALSIARSPVVALADGASHHRSADVTFTKWVTSLPDTPPSLAGILMVGVVGGDVGRGRFAGQVISDDTTTMPKFWLAHARYEFYGRKHFFIADQRVTEDDRTATYVTATIEGRVTKGWMKGARVTGEYTRWDVCPVPTPGNVFGTVCFQGTLHLGPVAHGSGNH
jgi:hypothetical protein